MHRVKGFLALLAAGIIYSINDIIIRLLGNQLSSFQQVMYRSLVAFLIINIILTPLQLYKHVQKVKRTYMLLYTLTFPIVFILFNASILTTKIADTVFSFFIGSLLCSLILEYVLFHLPVTKVKIFSSLLTLCGMICFSLPFNNMQVNFGFILGLISGALYTVMNTFIKRLDKKIDKLSLVAVQMFGGIVVTSFLLPVTKQDFFPHLNLQTVLLLVISGVLLLMATYYILIGFQNFDLNLGTIIISSELFFAPLFAFLLFHEALTVYEITGGILIGLAILIPQLHQRTIK